VCEHPGPGTAGPFPWRGLWARGPPARPSAPTSDSRSTSRMFLMAPSLGEIVARRPVERSGRPSSDLNRPAGRFMIELVLSAFEDAYVALLADAGLRERFRRAGVAALSAFALSPREQATLERLPLAALDRCAASLVDKRWREVARVVPLTLRIAPRLERFYRTWVSFHPARATDTVLAPGVAEGLRALPALRRELM